MTVEALVLNEKTGSYVRALLFPDTGAQVTLVEEHVADSPALPVLHSEQCTLSGIGGTVDTFVFHNVRIKILSVHGKKLQIPLRKKPVLVNEFPSVLLTEKDILFMEKNDTTSKQSSAVRRNAETSDTHRNRFIQFSRLERVPPIVMPSGLV
ncbi:unnamed protein product [Haemonchus placei]|uniref:Peptidase A2 domain-containing protein n=1 Tax=Haemonchus placei TaxID=6290 RepID=A0A0N4W9E1_HAEPC|nr:unnamed protein product [Haemonchus placei]